MYIAFTSHRVASRRVASRRVAPRRVASCHALPRRVPVCSMDLPMYVLSLECACETRSCTHAVVRRSRRVQSQGAWGHHRSVAISNNKRL